MTTKYDKLPLESLSDEQLDTFLDYINTPFDDDQKNRLKMRIQSEKKTKKIPFFRKQKRVLILLGTESQVLLANSERLDSEVTDQGLRFKALATFKNDETTYFLAELTDETGDRLAQDTQLFNWQMLNGGNSRVVDYNDETKTATILTQAVTTDKNAPTGYQLSSFLSHEQTFKKKSTIKLADHLNTDPEWLDISKQSTQGGGFDEMKSKKIGLDWNQLIKSGLKPNVLNVPLEVRDLTLSNLAYKDDLLHLQLKGPNTAQNSALFVNLINKETGKTLDYLADYQLDQGTHDNETGRSDYTEYVFDIPKKELAQVELALEGWDYGTYQKGNWAIQLKEPKSLPTKALHDTKIKDEKQAISLTNILLSPLSISFDYIVEELTDTDLTIEIMSKDGSKKELLIEDNSSYEGTESDSRYTYEFGYLELADVVNVAINGQDVPFK